MRGKRAGVVLGYLALSLQNLLAFFLTPFMLRMFGEGDFGVYRLGMSVASYFALADLGLSNAVVRYVSEYREKQDKALEARFLALSVTVSAAAGIVLLLFGTVVSRFTPQVFAGSFSAAEIDLLQRLLPLLIANGILNLLLNLTTGVMKAYGEFGLLKVFNIARNVVRALAVVALLLQGYGPVAVVAADVVLSAVILAVGCMYCFRKLRVSIDFRSVSRPYAAQILGYSSVVFVDALAFQLFNSANVIIVGIKISSAAVAVYSLGLLLSSLFFALSVVISDVLMPDVVGQVTRSATNAQLTDYMIKIGRIKLLVLALPVLGFVTLGQSFVSLWVGPEHLEAYIIALIVILPSMLAGISDVGLYVMWAKNKHKVKSVVSLAVAIFNILLSIVLVDHFGIVGAAIGTAAAWILGYVLFNNVYFHRVLGLDMIRFFKEVVRGSWVPVGLATAAAAVLADGAADSWGALVVRIAIVATVYVLVAWKVALNREEKVLVRSLFGMPS
ncbi:MAG: oligosaccharide flippase family protein [Actinobacteria bacterium]|nr:oligosaccharide flippase family protein [Actinomycetota bacterium]